MNFSYFNWSSGKDSARALYEVKKEHQVDLLITTINKKFARVSMHGLRESMLDLQAKSLGIPLKKIYLPEKLSMEECNTILGKATKELYDLGYRISIFGDIFLEDLRTYREEELAKVGLKGYFPIWKKDTKRLIKEFIDLGFQAIVVCVSGRVLDKSFTGRFLDYDFLKDLPKHVDPCGENGEFHTFAFAGPIFQKKICFEIGEIVTRTYPIPNNEKQGKVSEKKEENNFYFCDLIPKEN